MISGGIDIGGTKIEARLFSDNLATVEVRRIPTPKTRLAEFIDALAEQVRWLEQLSDQGQALPVGMAIPGLIDAHTGRAFTSNLPASGHDIAALLQERIGRRLPLMNDCQAFALSEANGGAGQGFRTVVGLIMGTGVGAGLTCDGRLTPRFNGSALEIGHIGIPAHVLVSHSLPLWDCGCGKRGCFEQYVSGTGLAALGAHRLQRPVAAEEIVASAQVGDAEHQQVLWQWAEIASELLLNIQLTHDPDCITLGGGLSGIPDVVSLLEKPFQSVKLGEMRMPAIRTAIHGDSSGARGAAIMATRQTF
ncbi:ROK family protein [Neorhizobium galegae]|uniref:ROK family protein n=1 Tax=Neorhizobium galegae TaxID=399 RepID=UPI0013533E61|nr:ROK family protein [Neorhizobium galegae]KAB1115054.1 ROK family protein [Neorhizobium galegae]MCQ1774397.1 ROK family protein [Neorhizobium galegae]MCQ1798945.1 ROK family protein [Neorhizobium galegae]